MANESFPENPAPGLVSRGVGLEGIQAAAASCRSCHLYRNATQTVFGEGVSDASVVLVGEQPGDAEDRQGEPFVGPSGALLDDALEEAGIDRSAAYVTNVVKHFKWKPGTAPGKPRLHAKPNRAEVGACRPWLEAELALVDPNVVVCLGATAAQTLLGSDFRVTRDHGRPIDVGGTLVVATLHPAAVLRGRGEEDRRRQYAQLVADLEVAREVAQNRTGRGVSTQTTGGRRCPPAGVEARAGP
jgi:DNA polymerase